MSNPTRQESTKPETKNAESSGAKPPTIYVSSTPPKLRLVYFDFWFTVHHRGLRPYEACDAFCKSARAVRSLGTEGDRVIVLDGRDGDEFLFVERVDGGFVVSLVIVPPHPAESAVVMPLFPENSEACVFLLSDPEGQN